MTLTKELMKKLKEKGVYVFGGEGYHEKDIQKATKELEKDYVEIKEVVKIMNKAFPNSKVKLAILEKEGWRKR